MVKKKIVLKIALIIVLAVVLFGGGRYYLDNIRPPEVSPRQVVEQYFDFLKKHNYKEAYELVSRQHYHDSYNQFIDRVSMYSPEMRLKVEEEILEKDKAVVNIQVFVPMEFGDYNSVTSMDLVRVKREWKIIHP